MTYSIKVSSSTESASAEGMLLFIKNFNSLEDYQNVAQLCDDNFNERRIGLFESLVIPIRTNNWNNFCKDFFLPTFFNYALKLNDIALKVIYTVAFIPLDLCTLPIRLITVIPRYFYNSTLTKETHPFYRYLIREKVLPANLADDHVYLTLTRPDNNKLFTHGMTFNFIQLPEHVSPIKSTTIVRG